MRATYIALLALFLTLPHAGCVKQAEQPLTAPSNSQQPTPIDASRRSPEEVLKTFYLSLAASNREAALACTTGDPLAREFVDSQVRLNSAFELLGAKAIERFPEDGKKLQAPPPALAAIQKLAEVPVTISGETATWPSNPAAPMKLVLVKDQWKIDLASSFPSPELLRKSNSTYDTIAAYITDVANEVAAGKYASVELVQQELKRRRQSAGR